MLESVWSQSLTCPNRLPGDDSMRTSQLNVGTSTDVSLKITEGDLSQLTASIRAPSGNEEPCLLKRLPNRHIGERSACRGYRGGRGLRWPAYCPLSTGISFTPKEVGEHVVSVRKSGKHVTNSPFKILVGPSEIGDASKVRVWGKGLSEGQTFQVAEFIVDTRNAGTSQPGIYLALHRFLSLSPAHEPRPHSSSPLWLHPPPLGFRDQLGFSLEPTGGNRMSPISQLSQLRESSAVLSLLVPTPWNPRGPQYGIFQNASVVGLDDKHWLTSRGTIFLSGHCTRLFWAESSS